MSDFKTFQNSREAVKRLPVVGYLTRCILPPAIRHGPKGIHAAGHRRYVGGAWEQIGRLQFDFMVQNGLQPHHYLLDIGCGSLRGGIHFIEYLDPEHYLGIDKEPELIEQGVREELGETIRSVRRPHLIVSPDFQFDQFTAQPDFALAQSLFTHLPLATIQLCLKRLRPVMAKNGVLFATFMEASAQMANPAHAHDHKLFFYTREQMEDIGKEYGWRPEYIGAWNHPRRQMMMSYRV